MNYLLILIIFICHEIPTNFAFTASNMFSPMVEGQQVEKDPSHATDTQSERVRRDSASVTYPFISIPGYRTNNNSTSPSSSSSVFCSSNQSPYPLKSIVVSNAGTASGVTLNAQDTTNSSTNTAKARGSLLVFNSPPTSRCYMLNFSPSTFVDMNNLNIQFIYDSTSNAAGEATRSFGSGYGYASSMFPYTSNQNAVCGTVICQNGGVCQYMGANGYQCQCDSSGRWLGNDCSKTNPCQWSPCYNGGQCYYLPDGTYYCQCPAGYTGSNCQFFLSATPAAAASSYNPCLSASPCQNGGTCLLQDNQGRFTCMCPQGYTGVNCQTSSYSANPVPALSNNCGVSLLKYSLPRSDYDRIVGGTPVKSHTWPWIVSIQTMNGGSHFCGGTLVDAYHVITAAHCFDQAGTSPNSFKIVAGLLSMRQASVSGVQQLAIDRIYRHEGYSSTALVNDITVIKLRTAAQITDAVFPICLPNGNGAQDPQVGQSVLIAGWGYTNSATKQIADQLQEATIEVLDVNGDLYGGPGCNAWARRGHTLNNGQQICAMSRDTRIDSCQGDSGGPLIGAVESSWYLFGIVSYGDAICGSSTSAGVYTRVSGYAAWIQQKLQL